MLQGNKKTSHENYFIQVGEIRFILTQPQVQNQPNPKTDSYI